MSACQLKRQRLIKFKAQRVGPSFRKGHQRRFIRLSEFTRAFQRDLLREQFIKLESLPGRIGFFLQGFETGSGGRMVQRFNRLSQFRKTEALSFFFSQQVFDIHVHQSAVNSFSEPRLSNTFARRIHRRQRFRQFRVRLDITGFRVNHFEFTAVAAAGIAEKAHTLSFLQNLAQRREVMEITQFQNVGSVVNPSLE